MLPLSSERTPSNAAELASAIAGGLNGQGIKPKSVRAEGSTWPALDVLEIDLTGAKLTRDFRLPSQMGGIDGEVRIAKFDLSASPANFEDTPLRVDVSATDAVFGFSRTDTDVPLFAITNAREATAEVEVSRADLEALIHSLAAGALKEKGARLDKVTLQMTSRDSRTLAFRVDGTAKMFVMSATITFTGEISIDDKLEARLFKLAVSGEGMMASMAGSMARPTLDKLEGKSFSLAIFALGALKLKEVEAEGGDSLRLRAKFAGT